MGRNKIIYFGEVLVDMTGATVTPETLHKGETAVNGAGDMITGTAEPAENLDEVLDTQDSLIAQIQTALEGKAAGGGKKTVTVTVTNTSTQIVRYIDADGVLTTIPSPSVSTTVEALGGILYYKQVASTSLTGSYVSYDQTQAGGFGMMVFVFLEDGGTMSCQPPAYGGQ